MTLPVVILAGGMATRLRPITETIPKALVEVAGEPFIFHQLRYLKEQGVSRVVLCVGHLAYMIEETVGNGSNFGLQVDFSLDGEKLLGTGGAIKKALPLLGDSFFILYGDSYLPIDFGAVEKAFHHSDRLGLLTVIRNVNQWDRSNVLFQNDKLMEYNKKIQNPKMQHIDYGLSAMRAIAFNSVNFGAIFDLADLYHSLSLSKDLTGFEVYDRFYEIGSFDGLVDTENYLQERAKNELR